MGNQNTTAIINMCQVKNQFMKTLFFSFMLLLLAAGCSKSNNTGNTPSNEIFPDKIGDIWHYLVYDSTTGGNIPIAYSQYNVDVSIMADTSLPGGIVATIWKYQFPGFADTSFVIRKGDTIQFLDNTVNLSMIKQYVIPFSVNSSWLYSSYCDLSEIRVIERTGVLVGQTNFLNSFHLSGNAGCPDRGFIIDEWFADNIGLVQSYFNPSGGFILTTHITRWLLMSYDLK